MIGKGQVVAIHCTFESVVQRRRRIPETNLVRRLHDSVHTEHLQRMDRLAIMGT